MLSFPGNFLWRQSMDKKDWFDAAAVVGWVSVWSALVYLVPTAGL
ncbi:hypothetical protein M565_ctg5P0568 [Vibrio cyclitrophicus FF75]|nr:hypothetical protein M565_ctg5P0568 [Vibrio cyclitrophicus FF75]